MLDDVLVLLALSVEDRARRHGVHGKGVTLKLTYADMQSITRSRLITAEDNAATIYTETSRLLEQVEKRPIRLIGAGLYNLSPDEGRQLTLDDLSTDGEGLRSVLVKTIIQQAEANPAIISLADDADGQLYALLREGNWSLSGSGLDVFANAGEIETANGGILHFVIPYESLAPYLDSKWLPVGRGGSGDIRLLRQKDVAAGSVEYFDRLTVEEDGEPLCLMVDGVVYDLELWKADYAGAFYPAHLLWHGSYLQNAALQLDTTIPEGIPSLMLRFRDADGNQTSRLISRSGEDGRLLLIDPDEFQTVG
jgi:hypothetical protein